MANILCVDDEPNVVTLKCAILEQAGHTVTASTSARDAISKLEHTTFDAVVTDWRLGDSDGRAVVAAAKSHSSLPVVVVFGVRRRGLSGSGAAGRPVPREAGESGRAGHHCERIAQGGW